MRWASLALSVVAAVHTGCGGRLVTIVPDGLTDTGTAAATSDPTFEVVARTAGIKDPLPVTGASVEYADLERALGAAVVRAVRPRHEHTLTVELIAATADYAQTRLRISLVARATLRSHEGNAFIAQTQAICRDAALVSPDAGGAVVWACMVRLGRDLGGWLDGLPEPKEGKSQ